MARKMRAVAEGGRRPVVVANGTEGEPVSAKDKLLLQSTPHLVLDGVALAAEAVGAGRAIICVEQAARQALLSVEAAVDERRARRVDPLEIELVATPTGYVVGEESALVRWLNGGPPKPTFVPPRPFEKGVAGRPTLVQNVETLAHLALLVRYGPDWFREIGTPGHTGSALITVSGPVARPGVYEIAPGTSIAQTIASCGGSTDDVRAVLVGGFAGRWLELGHHPQLALSDDELRPAGAALGAGVVVVLSRRGCGLAETVRMARYLAGESSGQCGPCVNGLSAIAAGLDQLHRGDGGPGLMATLRRWTTDVAGRGACHHPDGAVHLVASALEVFSDDIAWHALHGRCWADPIRQTGIRPADPAPTRSG
jgi:NADH:ubiquinone oxidoreductase subunit F (NADH-binding)